jgi:hypothetical protein
VEEETIELTRVAVVLDKADGFAVIPGSKSAIVLGGEGAQLGHKKPGARPGCL